MTDWNRDALWSARDPRTRERRARIAWSVASIGVISALFAVSHLSCAELYYVEEERTVPATIAPAQCSSDDDCVLQPSLMTCCGECEPGPPFEAMTRSDLEKLRSEVDSKCAPRTRVCEPPTCSPVPVGCEVRAACVNGRCRPSANDACIDR
jgi:hypothetical protein